MKIPLNQAPTHQIVMLNAPPAPLVLETDLEMYRRLSADPSIHICWTDEFLSSLPPRSEAESLALQHIQF